jgi:SAM-dependent methyltransferase
VPLKRVIERAAGRIGRMPVLSQVLRLPRVRRLVARLPGGRWLTGSGWDRIHPFDKFYGTDTSGFAAPESPEAASDALPHAVFYAGSQPGIVRHALRQLPPLDSFTFLDLGCGKGRPVLIATEFPFRAIIGVELSPRLADCARRNATVIAARHPERTPVRIVDGDASAFALPDGDVVLFLYHPFDAVLMARVAANVQAALRRGQRRVYVVYYNPVAGHCFDALPELQRRFAGMLRYSTEELGYGPDVEDPVVIWQSDATTAASTSAAAAIVVSEHLRVTFGD